jgi:hypothetical protein
MYTNDITLIDREHAVIFLSDIVEPNVRQFSTEAAPLPCTHIRFIDNPEDSFLHDRTEAELLRAKLSSTDALHPHRSPLRNDMALARCKHVITDSLLHLLTLLVRPCTLHPEEHLPKPRIL